MPLAFPAPALRRLGALLAAWLLLAPTGPARAAEPATPRRAAAPLSCPPTVGMPTAEQLAAAQRNARDRGLLWRIRKGGHDSYLFGTLHVGKLEWTVPGPQLAAALRNTETLAMELDITDPDLVQAMARSGEELAVPALPEALAARLARQRAAACVPPGALDRLHPLLQALTVSVLNARWEGLDLVFAQENALGAAARAMGRPIVSLETVQMQRDALIPGEPQAVLTALEEALDQLENQRARSIVRRLGEAWAQGDLADLERYSQWCDCAQTASDRALLRRMLDERNPGLATRIAELHQQGQRVLAAVGALHMVGPQGLPALLRERGFQVQRLHPPEP